MGALAQALDGRVAGDLKGGGNHCYVGGPDPRTGETFIFYEYPAGGTGGFDGGDGSNTVRTWTESDMTTLQPIEAVEQLYPVRIERTALREDSGGPGPLARRPRPHARGAHPGRRRAALSVLAEKAVLPPFGVCGGAAGATNRFWVRRGEPADPALAAARQGRRLPARARRRAPDGELGRRRLRRSARARSGARSPPTSPRATSRRAAAERDLRRGAGAPARSTPAATARAARDAARGAAARAPRRRWPISTPSAGRLVRLDADDRRRASASAPGAVVELVNPRGAPLRAWVDGAHAGRRARAARSRPSALAMLGPGRRRARRAARRPLRHARLVAARPVHQVQQRRAGQVAPQVLGEEHRALLVVARQEPGDVRARR